MQRSRQRIGFVTDRDKKLFQLLFENKVATSEQLQRLIFPEVNQRVAYRRIAKLVASGWLRKIGFPDGRIRKPVYSVTEKAFELFVREEGIELERVQLTSEVIAHDIVLVDIRHRFEKLSQLKRFYPENLLRSRTEFTRSDEFKCFTQLHTDAVAELFIQEKYRYLVPIEYEASIKSKERCQKKLFDYYVKFDGSTVFVICESEPVLKRMVEMDSELCQKFKPKMYFALLSDVINNPEKLTFTTSNQQVRIFL